MYITYYKAQVSVLYVNVFFFFFVTYFAIKTFIDLFILKILNNDSNCFLASLSKCDTIYLYLLLPCAC